MGWLACVMAAVPAMDGRAEKAATVDSTVLLKQALNERRVVTFSYHGHERKAEPHALGKGTKDKPVLLAWQTGGGSQTEPPPGWRVFLVAEITGLTLTDTTFAKPRPDYGSRKGGRGLKSVEAEVSVE